MNIAFVQVDYFSLWKDFYSHNQVKISNIMRNFNEINTKVGLELFGEKSIKNDRKHQGNSN